MDQEESAASSGGRGKDERHLTIWMLARCEQRGAFRLFVHETPECSFGIVCGTALFSVLPGTLTYPETSDFLRGVPYCDSWTFVGLTCFFTVVAVFASLLGLPMLSR
jgi:hypothetical protein